MKAMMGAPKNAPVAGAAAQVAENGDVNSPDAPHEAGIYLFTKTDAGPQMTQLEPAVYTQGKTGGILASAMTYGIAKMKTKNVVRGASAQLRCPDPTPVFYFYFEKTSAGLSNSSSGNSTPNEFTMIRFDVKGESRETVVMSMNALGTSSGNDEKRVVPFSYVKLRPGVYKVSPRAPLAAGEYGFLASPTLNFGGISVGGTNQVFDFGVN
jgi:hypothetical protein